MKLTMSVWWWNGWRRWIRASGFGGLRAPHQQRPGRRMQELRGYGTTTAQLLAMVGWLRLWRMQRVVMESSKSAVTPDLLGDA